MKEPTKKQKDFIDDICDELGCPCPNCATSKEAYAWISDHLEEYNSCIRSRWVYSYDEEDYELHGFSVYGS